MLHNIERHTRADKLVVASVWAAGFLIASFLFLVRPLLRLGRLLKTCWLFLEGLAILNIWLLSLPVEPDEKSHRVRDCLDWAVLYVVLVPAFAVYYCKVARAWVLGKSPPSFVLE